MVRVNSMLRMVRVVRVVRVAMDKTVSVYPPTPLTVSFL